jgi:RNase H-fold protein (predicted Holliday junction resolvase)
MVGLAIDTLQSLSQQYQLTVVVVGYPLMSSKPYP